MNKIITLLITVAITANSVANAAVHNLIVDDFVALNTGDTNNLAINTSAEGLNLIMGPGSSGLGRDAFGVGTSTFGQSGAWFDGSYAKFGNTANQQQLDFRITNNTGLDAILNNISFDIRKANGNANPTSWNLLYLATGDSELIKGASVAAGSEMGNTGGLGTGTINGGINNYSNVIGTNIQGTAWLAAGSYANIRLKINTGNAAAGSIMDNFSIKMTSVEPVPEVGHFGLLTGVLTLAFVARRRRS